MSWDQFVQFGTAIAYTMILWLLISMPATLVLLAVSRLFPGSPREVSSAVMRLRPASVDATLQFKEAKGVARRRLESGTVRIILDRKHVQLKRELGQIRATLDRRLQLLSHASKSSGGTSLIDLLVSFKTDTSQALQFDEIEDNLAEMSKDRASARFKAWVLITFALLITLVNSGLLYLFFDEMFAGLTVPYLGVELAFVVAILFPILEMAGGVGSELVTDKSDTPFMKLLVYTIVLILSVALGSLEYIIFYQLLAGAFQNQAAFDPDGVFHALVAAVGPALTLAQALFGFGIARNLLRLRELGAIKTIKDHVALAHRFVDGLENRYDRIEEAAARARQSIEEFAAQLKGRGEAELPVVTLLTEERSKFLNALDTVNPSRWKRTVDPAQGDVDGIVAYAWLLPIGVVLLATIFALVFAPAIQQSGLFPFSPLTSTLLAIGAAAASLITGGALFDRTTSAMEQEASLKDVLSPRDGAFKALSLLVLALLSIGTFWICIAAHGFVGFGEGAVLLGMIGGLSWASSYADLSARGLGYLGAVVWHGLIWSVRSIARAGGFAVLTVLASLAAITLFILHVAGWPITLARSVIGERKSAFDTDRMIA